MYCSPNTRVELARSFGSEHERELVTVMSLAVYNDDHWIRFYILIFLGVSKAFYSNKLQRRCSSIN